MVISKRSKLSLCQLLALYRRDAISILLAKHGLAADRLDALYPSESTIETLKEIILEGSAQSLGSLMDEAVRTSGFLRSEISPRYRFDERWDDLCRSLELDGYRVDGSTIVPIEPSIEGVQSAEDDLTSELRRSGLPDADEILRVLDNSAEAFRREDFNGCLGNARVALQTLATSIAQKRQAGHAGSFDPSKWGQVVAYLRKSDFITEQEESGLAGVFSFVSPGSHIPVGFTEEEFARLGRSLAVSLCFFLAKRFNARQE